MIRVTSLTAEAEVLLRAVEAAVDRSAPCRGQSAQGRHDCSLVRQLERLLKLAPQGDPAWQLAQRMLCGHIVIDDPWRAALLARKLVAVEPMDAEGWSLLGLSLSLEGHHRAATKAYRRALALHPEDAVAAHNLGHLYDVCLDAPARAIPLLQRAQAQLPHHREVTASLAHALHRAGRSFEALALMRPLMRRPSPSHHHELYRLLLAECRTSLDAIESDTAARPADRQRRIRQRRHTRT